VRRRCICRQTGGALGGKTAQRYAPPNCHQTDLGRVMVAATTLPPVEPGHVHLPVISRLPTVDTWTPQWPHGHAHRILVCPGQIWPCPPTPPCTPKCCANARPRTYKTTLNGRKNGTKLHMDRCANTYLGGLVPRHMPSCGLAWFECWPDAHQPVAVDISRPVVQVSAPAAKHA
jgi:hypothetical protein